MKILFFDIDGTLIGFDGIIPESAVEALRRAQAKGHKLFICSGRSRCQLQPALKAIDFDGFVTASGACVEVGDELIFHHTIPVEDVLRLVDYFEKNNMRYSIQTKDAIRMTEESRQSFMVDLRSTGKVPEEFLELIVPPDAAAEPIENFFGEAEKMIYHDAPVVVEEVKSAIGGQIEITRLSFENPNGLCGEVSTLGVHKALGMAKVLEYYGVEVADSFAFGDGPNDLEMMEYAGTSVALGNAIPEVKELADYVTASVAEDGIYKALEHFDLI